MGVSLLFHAVGPLQAANTVTFDNQSGLSALVKLVGPTATSVEVEAGIKKTVEAAPGHYLIKVRYGTPGSYSYSKGDEFDVTETATSFSKISITLHKVVGGNYGSKAISERDFEGTDTQTKPINQSATAATPTVSAPTNDSFLQLREAASWQKDWKEFSKQCGFGRREAGLGFEGKVVEWVGTFKELADPKNLNLDEPANIIDRAYYSILSMEKGAQKSNPDEVSEDRVIIVTMEPSLTSNVPGASQWQSTITLLFMKATDAESQNWSKVRAGQNIMFRTKLDHLGWTKQFVMDLQYKNPDGTVNCNLCCMKSVGAQLVRIVGE